MTVDHNYFATQAEVMHDIARTGFWPTTYVSGVSPELPCTYVLDENEKRVVIGAGDFRKA